MLRILLHFANLFLNLERYFIFYSPAQSHNLGYFGRETNEHPSNLLRESIIQSKFCVTRIVLAFRLE